MKIHSIIKLLSLLLFITGLSLPAAKAQTAHKYHRSGDRQYMQGDYSEAEEDYRRSLLEDDTESARYNLGNSIYQQERYDEAIKYYEEAARTATDDRVKSRAYHNLGNSLFYQQEYDKSVDAYKSALRLNPKDVETKENLAMAQRLMQIQQQQQQQQQQEGESEENEDQQQQQQQQEPQEDQQQQQNQQQQGDDQQGEQEQQEGEAEQQPKDLSKEEAQQLLDIIEGEERKVQEKMRKADKRPSKSEKDW